MSEFVVVIPARYGSSRLPGKPLMEIAGLPMVQHVWQRAGESRAARIVIATDDARIEAAALAFGAEVVMTRGDHPSGTDRLAEVAEALALAADTLVVNVQGDEPLLPAAAIDLVAQRLAGDPRASIATLAEPILDVETLFNPNVVKVVTDLSGRALYFSRAPIPWDRNAWKTQPPTLLETDAWRRHIGLYAYRAGFLADYVTWPPAPLEQLEQLEQLRALQQGHLIQVADVTSPYPGGVDTQEDLERVREHFAARGAHG
ncbi:3-deoxy-manno-octulosonate cytidylyltransferase [Salinicola endophyticus]|uniref:3-deoxy-manno-octulosonate cytidylyltransferase n=1 Tax=Salinicola endophyticus TaxID=1949083 RepID=A0ABY8FKP9_9GAMM|nr:3-deoxy-manno-octulosonate cytidylyltransferase [Salinicola endophyticus]WFF43107.1 3-deoxy-manno-octulosonate cytidylyltransferase [Salinicola endophyticus]